MEKAAKLACDGRQVFNLPCPNNNLRVVRPADQLVKGSRLVGEYLRVLIEYFSMLS